MRTPYQYSESCYATVPSSRYIQYTLLSPMFYISAKFFCIIVAVHGIGVLTNVVNTLSLSLHVDKHKIRYHRVLTRVTPINVCQYNVNTRSSLNEYLNSLKRTLIDIKGKHSFKYILDRHVLMDLPNFCTWVVNLYAISGFSNFCFHFLLNKNLVLKFEILDFNPTFTLCFRIR